MNTVISADIPVTDPSSTAATSQKSYPNSKFCTYTTQYSGTSLIQNLVNPTTLGGGGGGGALLMIIWCSLIRNVVGPIGRGTDCMIRHKTIRSEE